MKSRSAPSDPLIKDIKQWKKDQAIVSLTIDEMKEEAKNKKAIIEQKIDGQSAIMGYKEGEEPKFGSLRGVLSWKLPVLEEAVKLFKKKNIKQLKAVGELAGYENDKILSFNETESLIKNPKADKSKIHWFPYQILEINEEKLKNDFESYKKENWPEIKRIFSGAKYIHPVQYSENDIDKAWNKIVKKQKNEGIVVRLSNNKIYKAKPVFTYDLVIVAVGDKKGKNWPKGKIGNVFVAFMDNDKIFRTAGEIGTGWSDAEARELYSWAQKNKAGEDDTYVWVKPKKIMEVQWERSNIRETKAYKYLKGKYEPVGKKLSGTIVKPRFIRYRTDKSVNPNDLRLTQIPDWGKTKKMAKNVVASYIKKEIYAGQKHKKALNVVTRFVQADYPDHPNEIVITKGENPAGLKDIKEIDVYNYYEGVKGKLIPELRGYNLFIVIKPKGVLRPGQKGIYIRHPYDKKTEYIRINNEKEFEEYHSGRTVEYHLTSPRMVPWYIIDIDPGSEGFSHIKKVVAEVADELKKVSEVKKIEIRYTGKRGFHVLGWLIKSKNVNNARKFLNVWLKNNFGERNDTVIGESPKGKKAALGLSPMKLNGGHISKYSMRITGLCCLEVERSKLMEFKKEDASIEKTYKKITGKSFHIKMARRVIDAFLKESIIWTEPKRTLRLKERLRPRMERHGPPTPSEKIETEDLKPGEIIEVFENGKWVKKPWKSSLKNKEIRLIEETK